MNFSSRYVLAPLLSLTLIAPAAVLAQASHGAGHTPAPTVGQGAHGSEQLHQSMM
jgi:hypothetical protein